MTSWHDARHEMESFGHHEFSQRIQMSCVSRSPVLALGLVLCQMQHKYKNYNNCIKCNLYNHLNVHFSPAGLVRRSGRFSKQKSSTVLVLFEMFLLLETSQHLGQYYASLMASQFMAVKSESVRLTVKGPSTCWGSTCCSWEVAFMLLTCQELRGRMDFWKRWTQQTYEHVTYLLLQI